MSTEEELCFSRASFFFFRRSFLLRHISRHSPAGNLYSANTRRFITPHGQQQHIAAQPAAVPPATSPIFVLLLLLLLAVRRPFPSALESFSFSSTAGGGGEFFEFTCFMLGWPTWLTRSGPDPVVVSDRSKESHQSHFLFPRKRRKILMKEKRSPGICLPVYRFEPTRIESYFPEKGEGK